MQFANPVVARVHRIGAASEILLVQQHAFAERSRPRRSADHRDTLRMQQAAQVLHGDRRWCVASALTWPD